jgi:hypothetical protein
VEAFICCSSETLSFLVHVLALRITWIAGVSIKFPSDARTSLVLKSGSRIAWLRYHCDHNIIECASNTCPVSRRSLGESNRERNGLQDTPAGMTSWLTIRSVTYSSQPWTPVHRSVEHTTFMTSAQTDGPEVPLSTSERKDATIPTSGQNTKRLMSLLGFGEPL